MRPVSNQDIRECVERHLRTGGSLDIALEAAMRETYPHADLFDIARVSDLLTLLLLTVDPTVTTKPFKAMTAEDKSAVLQKASSRVLEILAAQN